jgi:hypothetical protein
MKVLDATLLLYAYDSAMPQHRAARRWMEDVFSESELVGIPWLTVSAFLRLMTDARLPGNRYSMPEAVDVVQQWIELPQVRMLAPGERHWTLLKRVLLEGRATSALTTDAQIAALTMEHGGVLYTADRDFARFPGLRWVNPLQA